MPFELIPPDTKIDFIGKRYICLVVSVLVILAGVIAIPLRGIRLGIDFAGGTEVQVRFAAGVPVEEGAIRKVVDDCGIADSSVVRFGEIGATDYLIRFRAGAGSDDQHGHSGGARVDHQVVTGEFARFDRVAI